MLVVSGETWRVFVSGEEIKTGAKEFYSSESDIFAERVGFVVANLQISVI